MNDENKTEEQLIDELENLRRRIAELEKPEDDLKLAEEALQESEERYRVLYEYNPSMYFSVNAEGIILSVNRFGAEQLGYTVNELIGQSLILKVFYEDDMEYASQNLKYSVDNYGQVFRWELRKVRKDGSIIQVRETSRAVKGRDGIIIVFIVCEDITQSKKVEDNLRKSEAHLRIGMDLAKLVSWEYDVESDIFTFDDHFYALYGTTAEKEGGVQMRSEEYAKKFIPPEEISSVRKEIAKSIQTDDPLFVGNGEHSIIRADGEKRYINVRFGIIKDENGKTVKSYGSNQDITERKNVEKEREKLIEELESSNEELQQFAYVASHDLQEPLRTIASFTQLLKRRYKSQLDKDADEFMDYITEAALRMKQQIEGLLEYSRVETKGEEFQLVNTNNILNESLKNLDISIKEANADITFEEIPNVRGDAGQLQRVFQNLISNAIKFRKYEKPLKIHISATKDEEINEYVFSISDNGIGMEDQYLERIFTIFQRLHTREEYEGTGMGLAIVKKIIDRHGGRIWVESEYGKGSTFYFTLHLN